MSHVACPAVFVVRFLWEYNGKPLFKDAHGRQITIIDDFPGKTRNDHEYMYSAVRLCRIALGLLYE